MGRIPALGGISSIEVRRTIGVNLMLAVRLIVILALPTLEARPNLRTNTNTLTNLGERHLGPDLENLADNLVADGERVWAATPIAANGVQVTGADTTALNLDVNVVVAKRTGIPRVFFKFSPFLGTGGLEAGELFRV